MAWISAVNCHIGIINLEPNVFKRLDNEIRKALIKYKIQLRQPRTKPGKRFSIISIREHTFLKHNKALEFM
jgi:hypothetical protein